MPATYNPADLSDLLNRARFELGDTDLDDAILDDAEITQSIELFGYSEGVAKCAGTCIVRVSQSPDKYKDEGGIDVSWSDRISEWRNLAKRLRSAGSAASSNRSGRAQVTTGPDMTRLGF